MPKPQRLPPRGLNDAASAAADVLREGRYATDPVPEPEAAREAPAPAKPARPAATRSDAEGMTRRTYYLAAADADTFESAAARIHDALHGLVPKHRILGALMADGVNNVDTITKRLKAELVAGLD